MNCKIKKIIVKYKSFLMYGIFGVLTTLVNIGVYTVCYRKVGIGNIFSNILAWLIAVSFAFITNKVWVFESKEFTRKKVIYEIFTFFLCRLSTGGIDLLFMYISVDRLQHRAVIMKCISNIIVIILNYLASKLVIFRKNRSKKG